MKLKTIIFALLAATVASACMKEGDFDELKHPFIFEADFDPVLGIPVAKMSATMGDIVKLTDSTGLVNVYIDSNEMVSVRYSDYMHEVFDYTVHKGSARGHEGKADQGDTLWLTHIIQGTLDIPLFDKLRAMEEHDIHLRGMYFTVDADVKGYTTDTMQSIFNHGIKLYFDSITLRIDCKDGFSPVIPFIDAPGVVDERELMAGQRLEILDKFDISSIVNRKPQHVSYTIRMNIAIPVGEWTTDDPIEYLNRIGVDSVTASIHSHADFPLQIYCKDVTYSDTADFELQFGNADSVLDEVERYMTLDTMSCIVIEAKNYIPLELRLNGMLLDSNMAALSAPLLVHDSVVQGAPVRPLPNYTSYVSNGYTKSRLVLPIDMQLLSSLRKARHLQYTLQLSSSARNAAEERPSISIRKDDKLELKAYIVVAPHVHIATEPVEIIY